MSENHVSVLIERVVAGGIDAEWKSKSSSSTLLARSALDQP